MFEERLILSIIVISLGFIIFLLSNLQKNILFKIFGWIVSACVLFFGISLCSATIYGRVFKPSVTKSIGDKLYKKAELNKIFDEVHKAWKDK